jgi:hypothetical protein
MDRRPNKAPSCCLHNGVMIYPKCITWFRPLSVQSQSQLKHTYDAADPVFVARKLRNLGPSAFLEVPHPHWGQVSTFPRHQVTSICREGQARDGLPRAVEQVALTVLLRAEEHHRTSETAGNRPSLDGGEYTVQLSFVFDFLSVSLQRQSKAWSCSRTKCWGKHHDLQWWVGEVTKYRRTRL